MMLNALAGWLSALAPLRAFSPEGVCTASVRTAPGCSVCDGGALSVTTEITGRRITTRSYVLFLRGICLCEADFAALAQTAADTAEAIAQADEMQHLPAGAEALAVTGIRMKEADDSGCAVYELTLQLTECGADVPPEQKG